MTATQKNRLGRGLAHLIGDLEPDAATTASEPGHRSVPVDALRPSPFNPRRNFPAAELDELAASIRERGLVQPIIVRARTGVPGYEIVAGERRWRAAQKAFLHEVPVIVRSLDDGEALELAIIENVQRADLNALEEGQGYRQLIDTYGHTQEELANVLGKSRSHVANTLRLLNLPEAVQKLVREGALSAGHARALVGRDDAEALAREIVRNGLSVREVEALMQETKAKTGGKAKKKKLIDADTRAAQSELSEALGLAVTIASGRGEAGELKLRYRSLEQFEDLRRRLLRSK